LRVRVAMIGGGYVGLVSGACFAEFGSEVAVVEVDPVRLKALRSGRLPIYEPGLDQLVAENVEAGRLLFTDDLPATLDGAEAVFIAARPRDAAMATRYVYAAAEQVARGLRGYTVVVTKSTVPVGTGRRIADIIRQVRPDLEFDVASNPEFLREGNAIGDFMRPDRVVIGADSERAREVLRRLYRPLDRGAYRVHRDRGSRTDQIRRQCVPRHESHVRQRNGGYLRPGWGRCARRRPGDRTRRSDRPQVPASRPRIWWLLLSEGHVGSGPHRAGIWRAIAIGRDRRGG
jgi:UDP-glucose/GDP-mannose dehydrogenase family, NAD binding domain